jgi:general secretion pathway protein D
MRTVLLRLGGLVFALAASSIPAHAAGKEPSAGGAGARLLTLEYVNAEVTDVIRALASQSGINVALNPNVKGQVTVHLRDKTVDEAIHVVANLAGLGAKRINDTYVIAPRSEMRQTLERLGTTRRIPLTYLAPQVAAEMLQATFPDLTAKPQAKAVSLAGAPQDLDAAEAMLKQNDVISTSDVPTTERVEVKNRPTTQVATALAKMAQGVHVEPAGNAVILSGTRAQVESAKSSLALLDVPGEPDVETYFYKIKYAPPVQLKALLESNVPDIKVDLGTESMAPSRPSFNPLSGQFVGATAGLALAPVTSDRAATTTNITNNTQALYLVLKGTSAALEAALKFLAKADIPPRQMVIEIRVVDTSPELIQNIGVQWEWNQFQFIERPNGTDVGPLGFGEYGRTSFNPLATLNAMIQKNQAKLLASPQIVVIDDQDASIFIGDTLRFQSLAQSGANGNIFTVVEVPVGIILLVHPRINDDEHITLRVHPVVSRVSALVGGIPQTSAREAETTVRVKDGDTLVIGGLIRDEDIKQMSKIPLLGDIPLLGYLFRNESRTHRRSEVMVFLTIRLMK